MSETKIVVQAAPLPAAQTKTGVSKVDTPKVPESKPPESTESVSSESDFDLVVKQASALTSLSKFDEIRQVLKRIIELNLPPAEEVFVHEILEEMTGKSSNVIKLLAKDEWNHDDEFGHIRDFDDAASVLLEQFKKKYLHMVWDEGAMWTYSSFSDDSNVVLNCYRPHDPLEVDRTTLTTFGKKPIALKQSSRKEIVSRIEARLAIENFFADTKAGVNTESGFVTVDQQSGDIQELPHDPSHKARHCLDFAYSKDANCPVFIEGLKKIFGSDENKILAFQEFLGALLVGIRDIADNVRTVLVIKGPPNSGKSTLAEIVKLLVPQHATASVSPELWGKQYYLAKLAGVGLNIVTELSRNKLVCGAAFKTVASREQVSARHPYGRAFFYTPIAQHLFLTNEWFSTDDKTDAFGRRFILISCDTKLTAEETDGQYLEKIQAELPGILNFALEGAQRLLKSGRFTLPKDQEDHLLDIQAPGDIVERFIRRGLEREPNADKPLPTEDIFQAFKAFAERNDIDTSDWTDKPLTHRRRIASRVKDFHGAIRTKHRGVPKYRHIRVQQWLKNEMSGTSGDGAANDAAAA